MENNGVIGPKRPLSARRAILDMKTAHSVYLILHIRRCCRRHAPTSAFNPQLLHMVVRLRQVLFSVSCWALDVARLSPVTNPAQCIATIYEVSAYPTTNMDYPSKEYLKETY